MKNIQNKLSLGTTFITKWLMVAVSATLMFAGVASLLDGVDKTIAYVTAFVFTFLLLKEIL